MNIDTDDGAPGGRLSLYDQVVAAHGADAFEGLSAPSPRAFGPGLTANGDASPLAGICYTTDFKAEEEWGCRDLRLALTGADDRSFQITKAGRFHVEPFTDVTGLALSTDDLSRRAPLTWGTLLGYVSRRSTGIPDYVTHFEQTLPFTQGVNSNLEWQTMPQLRTLARRVGVRPLPAKKAALVTAILTHPGYAPNRKYPHSWPGWFQDGRTLVLRADTGVAATLLHGLVDAVRAGTLGLGSGSGAFHTGLFLYDTRDESPELVARREADFDFRDLHMQTAKKLEGDLEADGWRVWHLGNPTLLRRPGDDEPLLRFWLNGSPPAGRQVFGWFTADELTERKFTATAHR